MGCIEVRKASVDEGLRTVGLSIAPCALNCLLHVAFGAGLGANLVGVTPEKAIKLAANDVLRDVSLFMPQRMCVDRLALQSFVRSTSLNQTRGAQFNCGKRLLLVVVPVQFSSSLPTQWKS